MTTTTSSSTFTTVNELEPRYSCLVYPTPNPSVMRGDQGAGCPYCTCYQAPAIQFQVDGDWSQPLSMDGVNQATDYRGLDTSTGTSYIGEKTTQPDGEGGEEEVWYYVIANSTVGHDLDGGVV